MTVLQIAMTDEDCKYAKKMINKAQGSFQLDGNRYPMGKTIVKVLEEWCRSKDFIKETKYERDINLAITFFKNDPEEIIQAENLIRFVEKTPNETNTKTLYDLILRLEPQWVAPLENQTRALVDKMKGLLK